MKKTALLLLVAAASNSATAQTRVVLPAGTPYTIQSVADAASTGNPVLYRWYRDGSAIPDATEASYTVPSGSAVGTGVEFKRAAYTATCDEPKYSNTIVITWCNLMIGGVCWADVNVTTPGVFAAKPDMYTEFYQWNQPNMAWPATGGLPAGTTWITGITAPAWTATPCPKGWRLPSVEEYRALHNAGHTWAAAGSAKGNAVAGRFYGHNVSGCVLPSTMAGCIFLPAAGQRSAGDGARRVQGSEGWYWSSTQADASTGQRLSFNSENSYAGGGYNKSTGYTIRCVQ